MSALEEDRVKPKYRCKQAELYSVAENIAASYEDHMAAFMDYNGRYTPDTGVELKAAMNAANALPDVYVRSARHAALRKQLMGLKIPCLVLWKQLTSYIRDGFEADVYNDMLMQAGHAYYGAAGNNDWEAVKGLMESAVNFVADNTAALEVGGMVDGFATALGSAQEAFSLKYEAFVQEEELAMEVREAKILANNALYAMVTRMCKDGKVIFRLKAALRLQFTFEAVLRLIHGGVKGHGVSGMVRLGTQGPGVAQAEVVLEQLLMDGSVKRADVMLTDLDGLFKFNRVRNGRYRAVAEKVGVGSAVAEVMVDGGPVEVQLAMGN
jgi:hypothetical protein